jgi:membrane protein YdbS with pleckstrin-like domain
MTSLYALLCALFLTSWTLYFVWGVNGLSKASLIAILATVMLVSFVVFAFLYQRYGCRWALQLYDARIAQGYSHSDARTEVLLRQYADNQRMRMLWTSLSVPR